MYESSASYKMTSDDYFHIYVPSDLDRSSRKRTKHGKKRKKSRLFGF